MWKGYVNNNRVKLESENEIMVNGRQIYQLRCQNCYSTCTPKNCLLKHLKTKNINLQAPWIICGGWTKVRITVKLQLTNWKFLTYIGCHNVNNNWIFNASWDNWSFTYSFDFFLYVSLLRFSFLTICSDAEKKDHLEYWRIHSYTA